MKRTVLILSLVALTTLVGCKREQMEPNPQYNAETKEVTAQFVLNIAPAGQGEQTKMTADMVQQNNNFRGIHSVHVYTYATGTASGTPYVLNSDGWTDANAKDFPLGTLYATGQIDNAPGQNAGTSSNRILQLSIPVGTDAVMFYGKALNSENPTMDQNKERGRMLANFSKNPKDIEFQVYRRIGTDADVADYDATGRLMIYVINRIMGASVPAGGEQNGYTNLPEVSWKELGALYEYVNDLYDNRFGVPSSTPKTPMDPLDEILGKAYSTFSYIKSTEYRAGSSDAIKSMMSNMWNVIRPVTTTATPTDEGEANAKRLALEIERRMDHYFEDNWDYKTVDAIKTIVTSAELMHNEQLSGAQWAALCWDPQNPAGDNFDISTYSGRARNLNQYPYLDFNIPEGAAQLAYNANTGEFSYLNPNKPLVNPNASSFNPRKYVYAPELAYYVNSPVRVNSTLLTSDNLNSLYPNGTDNWTNNSQWPEGWALGKVSSSTKSVAVRDNINYGVALLKTAVALDDGVTVLSDNRNALSGGKEADQTFSISDSQHPIALTGVLVGGVNPRYNWQFLRKYSTYDSNNQSMDFTQFDGVIYDDALPSTVVPTPTGMENYTLVYDNYNSSDGGDAAAQNNVYIALEFKNVSGPAFWGRDNLIPNQGKFYLVAQIKNTEARQKSIQWPTDHQIPPIYGVDGEAVPEGKKAGESKQIPRVFIQDFMTTAVFKLSEDALKKAYYTMPDLRTSNMSLGLSVELQWESGYVVDDLVF